MTREEYILSRADKETAEYFIKVWNEQIPCKSESRKVFRNGKIFANRERTKLTEYGNKVALQTILGIEPIERVAKFARFDFEDLKNSLAKGFKSETQKESFLLKKQLWWNHLRERMQTLRISKETLKSLGFDFAAAKKFYHQTI